MEHGGHCVGIVGLLLGSIRFGSIDRAKTWRAGGRHAEPRTEKYGLRHLDGLHVPESRDGLGWRFLFTVAQSGQLLAVVEGATARLIDYDVSYLFLKSLWMRSARPI